MGMVSQARHHFLKRPFVLQQEVHSSFEPIPSLLDDLLELLLLWKSRLFVDDIAQLVSIPSCLRLPEGVRYQCPHVHFKPTKLRYDMTFEFG